MFSWRLWFQFTGYLDPKSTQVPLPFHSGFSPVAPYSTIRTSARQQWFPEILWQPWVWQLMGQDCVSFPTFSLRYALVFWPIIQVHWGRAGEATWEWFCQGAAARPSGHDRAVQTASLCFVLQAWLSYRDLRNCGTLTLEVSLGTPPSMRRQELLSL